MYNKKTLTFNFSSLLGGFCPRPTLSINKTFCYPLANEIAKGYSNTTVRPSVTSL